VLPIKSVYSSIGVEDEEALTPQFKYFFRDHPNPKIIRALKLGVDLVFFKRPP